jgi:tRNA (cmo5U34)-methyltransferase
MVRLGEEHLRGYAGRYRYILGDFADGRLPSGAAGPYEAIVSSLAIHHLPPEGKLSLYRDIAGRLRPGGCFYNIDIVAAPDAELQELYDRVEHSDRAARNEPTPSIRPVVRHRSELQPLDDHLRWLRASGFEHVDVFWKRLGYALYGGTVPASR